MPTTAITLPHSPTKAALPEGTPLLTNTRLPRNRCSISAAFIVSASISQIAYMPSETESNILHIAFTRDLLYFWVIDAVIQPAAWRMRAMTPIATGATSRPIPPLASSGGVPHFGYGFRPFFLAGAIYAATEILVWVHYIFGSLNRNCPARC